MDFLYGFICGVYIYMSLKFAEFWEEKNKNFIYMKMKFYKFLLFSFLYYSLENIRLDMNKNLLKSIWAFILI